MVTHVDILLKKVNHVEKLSVLINYLPAIPQVTDMPVPWLQRRDFTKVRWLLTHWDRVTHICVRKLTNIGSDNVLSPGRRQSLIWTNAGMLIGPLGTNFNEMLIEIHTFSFTKIHLNMSSGKWRPFCLGLNVLMSLNNIFDDQTI